MEGHLIDPNPGTNKLWASMERQTPEVSLIVPAYNEQSRIRASLEEIARFAASYPKSLEIKLVDDGSRDRTAEIVREFQREHPDFPLELLQYGGNRGKGFAVAHGLRAASGKFLAFSDTDLSAPIDQLPLLIDPLEKGADVVIASRRMAGSVVVGLPLSRRLMGRLFSLFSRMLVLPGVTDTQCGFKAYRREVAHQLVERQTMTGYTFDVEHLLIARELGLRMVEVPVKWIYSEDSQINSLSDSIKMFRDLIELRRLHARAKR